MTTGKRREGGPPRTAREIGKDGQYRVADRVLDGMESMTYIDYMAKDARTGGLAGAEPAEISRRMDLGARKPRPPLSPPQKKSLVGVTG